MKVALYVGDHAGDDWLVRRTCRVIRWVQKGPYRMVTHVEAILEEYDDGSVKIASSSLRDGGVRSKQVKLTPGNWVIIDVPLWDVERARAWFALHDGQPYDWRGAAATQLPGYGREREWFCNEAVGASVGLRHPENFGPHQFASIAVSIKSLTP